MCCICMICCMMPPKEALTHFAMSCSCWGSNSVRAEYWGSGGPCFGSGPRPGPCLPGLVQSVESRTHRAATGVLQPQQGMLVLCKSLLACCSATEHILMQRTHNVVTVHDLVMVTVQTQHLTGSMHAVWSSYCALLTLRYGLLCLHQFDRALPVMLTMVCVLLLAQ